MEEVRRYSKKDPATTIYISDDLSSQGFTMAEPLNEQYQLFDEELQKWVRHPAADTIIETMAIDSQLAQIDTESKTTRTMRAAILGQAYDLQIIKDAEAKARGLRQKLKELQEKINNVKRY